MEPEYAKRVMWRLNAQWVEVGQPLQAVPAPRPARRE